MSLPSYFRSRYILTAFLVITFLGSLPFSGQTANGKALDTARNLEQAFQSVSRQVRPSVVTIYTTKEVQRQNPFGNNRQPFEFFGPTLPAPPSGDDTREVTGLGSGMFISEDGYILTNQHVIANVDEIEVRLHDRRRLEAEVVAADKATDLAVIKVDENGHEPVEFADSEQISIGQWAIAIGSPFDFENSVTIGHVNAKNRSIQTAQRENDLYADLIQTDAAINQGNSGGPLVSIEGKVIGVNTLIHSRSGGFQGIGFAISSNLAQRVANDLIEHGEFQRPWIGVYLEELSAGLADHFDRRDGAMVPEVIDGSPAAEAGLPHGSLIIEADGKTIRSPQDLVRHVLYKEIGDKVTLTYINDGETDEITIKLGSLDESQRAQGPSQPGRPDQGLMDDLGLRLQVLPADQARRNGLDVEEDLLVVRGLARDGSAARSGLRHGDVIVEVDNQRLSSLEEFRSYLDERIEQGKRRVLVRVLRGERLLYRSLVLPREE